MSTGASDWPIQKLSRSEKSKKNGITDSKGSIIHAGRWEMVRLQALVSASDWPIHQTGKMSGVQCSNFEVLDDVRVPDMQQLLLFTAVVYTPKLKVVLHEVSFSCLTLGKNKNGGFVS